MIKKKYDNSILEKKISIVDTKSFYKLLENDENQAINQLNLLTNDELKQEIINIFFESLINNKDYKTLNLLNSILDDNLRDKAIFFYYDNLSEVNDNIFKLLNILSNQNLKDTMVSDFFEILFEVNQDKAIQLFVNIKDKIKKQIIFNSFDQLVEVNKNKSFELLNSFLDTKKSIQLLNSILDNKLRDEAIAYSFNSLLEVDNNTVELLDVILDKKIKDTIIVNSFKLLLKINQNKALELLKGMNNTDLKIQLIANSFNKLSRIDKNKSFQLLNLISDTTLRDKTIIEYFEILLNTNINKSFELLTSIDDSIHRDKGIVKFFGRLLISNQKKSIKLLDLIKNKNERDNLIYKYIDILNIDKSESYLLIDSIHDENMKQKLLRNREPKELTLNSIREKIYTMKVNEAFKLLSSIKNKGSREKEITKFFLQKFEFTIERIDAIKLFSLIQEEKLKNKIITDSVEYLFSTDINKTFKLLDLLFDINLKKDLIVKYLEKLLLEDKYKSLEIINSIMDKRLKDRIIKILIKQIFIMGNENILIFLESIPISTLKDDFIVIFINNFSKKFPKKVILELLNLISIEEIKTKKIFNFFNRLFREKHIDSFELLLLVKDEKLKNELLSYSIQSLLKIDRDRTFKLYYSLTHNYEISISFLKKLLTININEALIFLNSISNEKLKEEIILNSFNIFFKKDKDKAFEFLAYSYLNQKLQYKIINTYFHEIIEQDRTMAKDILNLVSKEISDKIIISNAEQLITVYLNNHKIKNRIFEIVGIVNDKKLKSQLTIDYFDIFFSVSSYKAIRNLNYLDKKTQDKIVITHFPKLINIDKKASIKLLKRVINPLEKEKLITNHFKLIFYYDPNKALALLRNISNKTEKEKLAIEAFPLFAQQRENLSIILMIISDKKRREYTILETINRLIQQGDISTIRSMVKEITISDILRKKIQKSYNQFAKINIEQHIFSLHTMHSNQKEKIKKEVIDNAYETLHDQEEENQEFDLDSASANQISQLVIYETNKNEQQKFLTLLIEKMREDETKEYSKLAYQTLAKSRLFGHFLYQLEEFIQLDYFKRELAEFKKQKETEQSISKMVGKVLKNPKNIRQEIFMQRFKRLRKIRNLKGVIPYVAKSDFELAQLLVRKLKREDFLEVEEQIFLNEYQQRWEKALVAYEKVDDFYTKVNLSKRVLNSFVPAFENSFFIQTMMMLDNQNIAQTPNELATIAPKEVLKYYGEIEDEREKALDEVIEQIKILQQKAKSSNEEDDEVWDEIEDEERRIKKIIKSDEGLYELFVERYDVGSFRRFSLLEFSNSL